MPKLKKRKLPDNGAPKMEGVIFIRCHLDFDERVKALAAANKRDKADYCRIVLEEHVENAEKARKTA